MEYIALGCMSGTSLDGIDCSLVKSDGVSYVTDISNEFILVLLAALCMGL